MEFHFYVNYKNVDFFAIPEVKTSPRTVRTGFGDSCTYSPLCSMDIGLTST